MELNYLAIIVCAVLSMVLGALWYGPLFGAMWLKVIGADQFDVAARKEMQKRAMPLYAIQFVLTLFQVYVLAHFIGGWEDASGIETSLWIWAAFVVPIVAGGAMWNNDSTKVSLTRFLIQAGYQLALFVLFGFILGVWR